MPELKNTKLHTDYKPFPKFNNPDGTDPKDYETARNNYIARKENEPVFVAKGTSIIHDDGVGLPTLGYGFNLNAVSIAQIEEGIKYALGTATLTANQTAGIKLLKEWKDKKKVAADIIAIAEGKKGTAAEKTALASLSLTHDQAYKLLDGMLDSSVSFGKYEAGLTTALGAGDVGQSTERIALLSNYYNLPALIGTGVKNATTHAAPTSRAETWFEVKYNHTDFNEKGAMHRRAEEADQLINLISDEKAGSDAQIEEIKYALDFLFNKKTVGGTDAYSVIKARDKFANFETSIKDELKVLTDKYAPKAKIDVVQRDTDGKASGITERVSLAVAKGAPTNNMIFGEDGNDTITGGAGDDVIIGGKGTDTAVYTGECHDYEVTEVEPGRWKVKDKRDKSPDGTDRLLEIEKLKFSNGTFKLEDGKVFNCKTAKLAFVIDTTGSMDDDIASVKSASTSIISAIFERFAMAEIGVVGYKDPDEVSTLLSFTKQEEMEARKTAAINAINGISVGGGGDYPEGVYSGLKKALDGSIGSWSEEADVRRIILFGDAPPNDDYLASTVHELAMNAGTALSSIAISHHGVKTAINVSILTDSGETESRQIEIFTVFIGYDTSAQAIFEKISHDNGGQSFYASNASAVVEALLDAIDAPSGEEENKLIIGTDGADSLIGGYGNDTLRGGAGDDALYGGAGKDVIEGGEGRDLLCGNEGDDTIYGGAGMDTIRGGDGNDLLLGSSKNDHIYGDAGNDTIDGYWGIDIITGGQGADVMKGGLDVDTFRYTSLTDSTASARDVILDFAHGVDKIDLKGLGFTGIHSGSASGTELGMATVSGHTILTAAGSGFSIEFATSVLLDANDFLFS